MINDFILRDELTERPHRFSVLGIGTRCLALSHREMRDRVFLLHYEASSEGECSRASSGKAERGSAKVFDRVYTRTIMFAQRFDNIISAGLPSSFLHPSLISSEIFLKTLSLNIQKKEWNILAARTVKRIPGQPLVHFKDGVSHKSKRVLARDLAEWMHALHSTVGPAALALLSQEKRSKKGADPKPTSTGKFKYYVKRSRRKWQVISEDDGNSLVIRSCGIAAKAEKVGLNPEVMAELSQRIEKYLGDAVLEENETAFIHGDLHFGNVIVDSKGQHIRGVCDWMNKGTGCRAVDFMALGEMPGFLPLTLERYAKLEGGEKKPISFPVVYAYATAYLNTILLHSFQYKDSSRFSAKLARCLREQVAHVARENKSVFGDLGKKLLQRSVQIAVPSNLGAAPI